MNDQDLHITESIADGTLVPEGKVKVQIFNERGKIRHEEEKPNFIAKPWKAFAKGLLRQQWMGFGYNPSSTASPLSVAQSGIWPQNNLRFGVPSFPAQAIAAWNQTTAEDAVNEHTPLIPPAGIVAWATRHPYGSASGARGNVNSTESITTDYLVRHVFDWLTSQGNGTFQSVGWLPMSVPGIFRAGFGINFRRSIRSAAMTPGSILSNTTPATTLWFSMGFADQTNDKFYFIAKRGNAVGAPTGYLRILSIPLGSNFDLASANSLGTETLVDNAAVTVESDEMLTLSAQSSSVSLHGTQVIGRDGTSTIFTYATTQTIDGAAMRWAKVGPTGAAVNYPYRTGAQTGNLLGTVLSGTAYLSCRQLAEITPHTISSGAAGTPFWIDAAGLALCTAAGIVSPRVQFLLNDGTDLIVGLGTANDGAGSRVIMLKITTSGTTLQMMGTVPQYATGTPANYTETAAAPFAGPYYFGAQSLWHNNANAVLYMSAGTASSSALDTVGTGGQLAYDGYVAPGISTSSNPDYGGYIYHDGGIYFVSGLHQQNLADSTGTRLQMTAYRAGYDLGSRVLLGASATKLATETMKITYDITLPGWHD